MLTESPVLHLGLAGFSNEEQELLDQTLLQAGLGGIVWQSVSFDDADAWWINGLRTTLHADGALRIDPPVTYGHTFYLNLREMDRPVAFSVPLRPQNFEPAYRFDTASQASMNDVLDTFETLLGPVVAQFRLASQLLEHDSALSAGIYHVKAHGTLLATVNLQGDTGVLPTAGPADFEDAIWSRQPEASHEIPKNFVRTSLAQLMWQYAVRTSRDVLPKRYRSGLIYFRRLPRVPQRLLKETHLLLLRELAGGPAGFDELRQRTGLDAAQLAHDIAALYLVGAVTSNPRRATGAGPALGRRAPSDTAPTLPHAATAHRRSLK